MRNDKFWDECDDDSIRQKVAEFIDHTPAVCNLKDKAYYDFEDALVEFIEQNRQLIYDEVAMENYREDVINYAAEKFEGKDNRVKELPVEKIDALVEMWQEDLLGWDDYWDINWNSLSQVLEEACTAEKEYEAE